MKRIITHKCPVCNWLGTDNLPKHIINNDDELHKQLKKDIVKKYIIEKSSPFMIAKFYNITCILIVSILKKLNIDIRNHKEAVANAVQENRQNINAYGFSGFRKDLNSYFRSCAEANFARILKYEKIDYKQEIAFKLFDENHNFLCTYFLDFLIADDQGFEIKGYEKNGLFKNKEKIILFKKQYPNIKLKVLFCSSKEWKDIQQKYEKLIPLWESKKQNIKNCNLY
jgi:hypothetical protein